jgi:hypothetical protein
LLAWLVVWLPFLLLGPLYRQVQDNPGDMVASSKVYSTMAWIIVIGAHVAIGVLPAYLWGRLEGLPVMFLAALMGWVFTWLLASWLGGSQGQEPVFWLLAMLLGVKVAVAFGLLGYSLKRRHITWKYVAGLWVLWISIGLGLASLAWRDCGNGRAVAVLLLLPLIRPAACPLAVALNRHR